MTAFDIFEKAGITLADGVSCRSASNPPKNRGGRPLSNKTLAIRQAIIDLTDEYASMTVRQIFYALTVRGIVPKNENAGYRPVQTQVLKMRREGLLDWSFISDATRWVRKPETFDRVEDALATVKETYRRNLWRSQKVRIEVWMEKDALAGVAMEATAPWDVALMVSRGTTGATFLHGAAKTAEEAWARWGVRTSILALYDRDAAGHRAARTVERGLREYAPTTPIDYRLLAVTDEQIVEWDLPSRPAKQSDPEAAKFDGVAVELDAIPPDRLVALITAAITAHIDPDAWKIEQAYEADERRILEQIVSGGQS